MSGPIARIATGLATVGVSEAFQEKPFQDVTEEDRPTKGAGGYARLLGPGSQLAHTAIAGSGTIGEDWNEGGLGTGEREVNASRGRTLVDAENAATAAGNAKKEADEFEASAQGDSERRKRSAASSGRTGYARRASKELTTTLSGTAR